MARTYLKNFFNEKLISYQLFEIMDQDGLTHFIDTDVVIEAILNASVKEQLSISNTIRRIDFINGNVNEYLKFLAGCLVKQYNQVA